ncbi:tRNA nucleotidyltransferase, archaeal type [Methanosarcina vacuolata Z-761]|uniref:tRNA nucleotidyltransferase, archaeal type n=1 Tax=Methanosarcina vacuolata Z-761 TaxID=1434123 RepID=A0A0E3Q7H4_9EURY|nr:tRNA nucleotidyltransferase, archaeal type [Methanosarcina vacuolata Z-761]
MRCSLGKQVYTSVNKEIGIIEDVKICRLEDSDFRVFLREWM